MAAGRAGGPRSVRLVATALVVTLVGLMVISALATLMARLEVSDAQGVLRRSVLPAETKTATLESVLVKEETGQRGFLLTGNRAFLKRYENGARVATSLETQLRSLVARDGVTSADLRAVSASYDEWRSRAATPAITAREGGPVAGPTVTKMLLEEQRLFGTLRIRLQRLITRTTALTSGQLDRIAAVRRFGDVVTIVITALAALAAVLAVLILRRLLTRPLDRLVRQVRRVAEGDYRHTIEPMGAAELVTMAEATERMRQSLVQRSRELVETEARLTLRAERDRVAADLHDLSIQRMYALGLSLASTLKRHPVVAPAIEPLIAQTDEVISELRTIIFNLQHHGREGLRRDVERLARESGELLGFAPAVELRGPLDETVSEAMAPEVLAVVREALSNVVRHACATAVEVTISVSEGRFDVVIADNGVGPGVSRPEGRGIRNMQSRAARLGGSAWISERPGGGSVLTWSVPVTRERAAG